MNGILNIYKEAGWTSHDVVAKLRGITGQKKIGHTGTLDPEAEGVLPVCLGKATKVADLLMEETKTYEAVLLLGTVTDTQDTGGQVLRTRPVTCSPEELEDCLKGFLGEQMQVPPMYSALKQNGKKLYELAREGKTVERQPRKVHFYELELLETDLPRARIRVTCSRGTYIRTLCQDIGEKLGCGGCMEHLVRTGWGISLWRRPGPSARSGKRRSRAVWRNYCCRWTGSSGSCRRRGYGRRRTVWRKTEIPWNCGRSCRKIPGLRKPRGN